MWTEMTIKLKEAGKRMRGITLPTALLLNRLSAARLHKRFSGQTPALTPADMTVLMKEIKRLKKMHRRLCLLEAQTREGDYILIEL